MTRRCWTWIVLISIFVLMPLTAGLFVASVCSRPGVSAPPPLLEVKCPRYSVFAFSPDSRLVAIDRSDRVEVYDLEERHAPMAVVWTPNWIILSLSFTPDSRNLLIESDGKILEFDATTGGTVGTIEIPGRYVEFVSCSATAERAVAIVDNDRSKPFNEAERGTESALGFNLREPATYQTLFTCNARGTRPIKFSRDGRLAVGCDLTSLTLKIWDTSNWSVKFERPAEGCRAFSLDSDARFVAWTNEFDRRCFVWSLEENRQLEEWKTGATIRSLEFHSSGDLVYVENHSVFMQPLGGLLVVRDSHGQTKARCRLTDGRFNSMALSRDGRFIGASGDGGVRIWRWEDLAKAK